jgi:hypothetical protein
MGVDSDEDRAAGVRTLIEERQVIRRPMTEVEFGTAPTCPTHARLSVDFFFVRRSALLVLPIGSIICMLSEISCSGKPRSQASKRQDSVHSANLGERGCTNASGHPADNAAH